ncbi:hypothetical protein [Rhodopirellula sp. MGV]|uniref:hypothetical protein n=1 Tax=Rhodopirellula sp. MGV TaxID=2023130 RepID=UPI000B96F4C3|nr:hypothetical protein [Rhodopirellula sp. MGV]OYP30430.1 hypothetical protein CGZ80_22535 [Rhodopirellula sp. MGV]PNY34775.1 hypothetical protein C2E31_21215 [Rhodopirellula baltica]
MTDDFLERVRQLVTEGKKVAAVRLVRERQRCTLREALDVVDSIECGEQVELGEQVNTLDDDEMDRVLDAIEQGRTLAAIKLYREATGRDLRESKEFVENLIRRMGSGSPKSTSGGCFGLLMIAASLAAAPILVFCWGLR